MKNLKKKDYPNLDAETGLFFARSLEHVKSQTYDVKYAALKARQMIPVSFEADPGAESITYEQYDMFGVAALVANFAKDFPRADIAGKEFTSPVKSLGASYGYNIQQIRAAAMKGLPLQTKKAFAARRAIAQKENTLALFGDADTGLNGFLNHPNLGTYTVPADGTGASALWTAKTPDLILRDMNGLISKTWDDTKGEDPADTLLLPLSRYRMISTTARSSTSDTTILEYFLKNNDVQVGWMNELETAGAGPTKRMLAYKRDPNYITMEVPQDFEQFEEQAKNLEFVVPCHSRFGGVIIYYPLSFAKGDGI